MVSGNNLMSCVTTNASQTNNLIVLLKGFHVWELPEPCADQVGWGDMRKVGQGVLQMLAGAQEELWPKEEVEECEKEILLNKIEEQKYSDLSNIFWSSWEFNRRGSLRVIKDHFYKRVIVIVSKSSDLFKVILRGWREFRWRTLH